MLVLTAGPDRFETQLDPAVVHALVSKPFDCAEVIALVRAVLAARASVSARQA